jgi:hypothetical protein
MGAVIPSTRKWYDGDGMLHRDDDLPAAVEDGYWGWYCHGKLHRDGDLPAVVHFDHKTRFWYQHGKLHRDGDLPALMYTDGSRAWYKHGKLHRDGDLPAKVCLDGFSQSGTQRWYKHGELHRDGDLPAVVWSNGMQEWWVDGVHQTPADRAQTRAQTRRWSPLRAAFVGAVVVRTINGRARPM